jgi:hypothetical protein
MSDAELRDITEFGGIEVLFGKIPTIPMNGPLFITGSDTGNHFKEGALTASGGPDDRDELSATE